MFVQTTALHHRGVMAMLAAAVEKAESLDIPQCICIVDASGVTLGEIRMSGAKFTSMKSAATKARTAASIRAPSSSVPAAAAPAIAAATSGDVTGLAGGFPIVVGLPPAVHCVGGVGVGSGSPEQDCAVAVAALAAIGCSPAYSLAEMSLG
jgi:uncharacterized protein GlcG (DUF336 family)